MRRREMGKGEGLETAFDQAGVWKVVASRPFWTSRSQPGSSWLQTMSWVPCTSSVPTEPASICRTDRTLPIQSTTYGGTAYCVMAESGSIRSVRQIDAGSVGTEDRKSTRLNSSHQIISY